MNKGRLFIVSGPSGAGKGTVLAEVFKLNEKLKMSVSATTRRPRPGEIDGVHYHFIDRDEFLGKIERNEMLEYAEYCGNFYGTPADYVEQQRQNGYDVVLEIEPCGAAQVQKRCPDALSVFIMPPSLEILRSRLVGRGTEKPEVVAARIAQAEREIAAADRYDYCVINDVLEKAVEDLNKIFKNV